jgi:hypothetical protein
MSESLNLPGRTQVTVLKEDSREAIVETFFMRNASYLAMEEDMKESQRLTVVISALQ